ncbi:hypothetical protein T492DRAFT_928154 [Pavlovales sp. CCMP2436]|nr:hypothetical protein T492DRAFT_928154 [Pavlovales sp. CCMP2436]
MIGLSAAPAKPGAGVARSPRAGEGYVPAPGEAEPGPREAPEPGAGEAADATAQQLYADLWAQVNEAADLVARQSARVGWEEVPFLPTLSPPPPPPPPPLPPLAPLGTDPLDLAAEMHRWARMGGDSLAGESASRATSYVPATRLGRELLESLLANTGSVSIGNEHPSVPAGFAAYSSSYPHAVAHTAYWPAEPPRISMAIPARLSRTGGEVEQVGTTSQAPNDAFNQRFEVVLSAGLRRYQLASEVPPSKKNA